LFSQASEGVGRLWRADAVVRATVGREREVAVSAHALGYAVCVPLPDREARPVDLVHPLDFAIVFILSDLISIQIPALVRYYLRRVREEGGVPNKYGCLV
jgi:hypothetical protein